MSVQVNFVHPVTFDFESPFIRESFDSDLHLFFRIKCAYIEVYSFCFER